MIRKKERGQYVIEYRDGENWIDLTTWEFLPSLFRRFLDYVWKAHAADKPEEREKLRIRRLPFVWGQAEYHFDGRNKHRIKNDEGYSP